ncbi:hypothetical protein HPB49_019904 [Dermacentor silvarum]|uniref:Uncharacterized protein n=1 Tax=Dermacentor silvarum TaxID=543639 RepID=A0ACB8DR72_DERSI|nr:hypothetical protein HPB49_019904 [Dermacentor silvarum]
MPESAPRTNQCNPSFHQPPFSMSAIIQRGDSGTAASSMAGSPHWHRHHQYMLMPAANPHPSINGPSYGLHSASTSATPCGFAHSTSAAVSGLHSPQYFQQPGTSNHHMANPFHASATTPSKTPGCPQAELAAHHPFTPSPFIQQHHIHQSAFQKPHTYCPSLVTLFHQEAMPLPAATPTQPVPSSHQQPIGICRQHKRWTTTMIAQQQDGVGGQTSQSPQQHKQQQPQQQHLIQRPDVLRVQQMQHMQKKGCYGRMAQQCMNNQSIMPPMSSSYQMMAPQSHLHSGSTVGRTFGGLDPNIQPIFALNGHEGLSAGQNTLLHHPQQRLGMYVNSMNQENFAQLPQQTAWTPPEASTVLSIAQWAVPEAGAGAETADAKKAFQMNNTRPADEKETASSRLRDLERAIPSLDSARVSTRFQKLLSRLKARGVDLQETLQQHRRKYKMLDDGETARTERSPLDSPYAGH